MKSKNVLGLLLICLLVATGCSNNSEEGNGGPNALPPDADGNTVHMDKLKAQQVVGGCTLELNGAAASAGTTACVDFVQTPANDVTPNKVSAICSQMQGRSDFVKACPIANVNALCRFTITGTIRYVMVYNDNNASDLKNFATNCAKQGGQANP